MKLKVGDIIDVHGYVMLDKLDEGSYRVKSISSYYHRQCYDFTKPRGKKVIVRHLVDNVDLSIKDKNNPDLNKIVKR